MIFLVRHGEAAAGWGDHPDPGLSDLGKKQAEAVAATLANLGAKSAISSPMLRCRETALPFEQRMGLVARVAPEVSEIDTPDDVEDRVLWLRTLMGGDWQGGSHDFQGWRKAMLDFVTSLPDDTSCVLAGRKGPGPVRTRRQWRRWFCCCRAAFKAVARGRSLLHT